MLEICQSQWWRYYMGWHYELPCYKLCFEQAC